MLRYIALIIALAATVSCQGQPKPQAAAAPTPPVPRQLFYLPERQQYAPDLQFALLDPQFQIPTFNFAPDRQPFPRVEPQILFYPGGAAPGQSFLLQPGAPPGNFLVPQPQPQPQPGPNIIFRNGPQRPVFVAGYPKPAHIPPIEKDAEEIPTNPEKIPPFPTTNKKNRPANRPETRPEKLETFNEDNIPEGTEKEAGEAPGLAAADRGQTFPQQPFPQPSVPNLAKPNVNSLRPGQRFFVLNGVPLFANYPFAPNNPEFNFRYTQPNPLPVIPQQEPAPDAPQQGFNRPRPSVASQQNPIQNQLHKNPFAGPALGNSAENQQTFDPNFFQNLVSQDNTKQEAFFRSTLPLRIDTKSNENVQLKFDDKDFKLQPFRLYNPILSDGNIGYFQYQADSDQDNDAIIVDAATRNDGGGNFQNENEGSSSGQGPPEPSISQAHPGAIALAGPGGVAAAGPRGTALVGVGGLAVSSPQATAVAGPDREDTKQNENKKPENNRARKGRRQ